MSIFSRIFGRHNGSPDNTPAAWPAGLVDCHSHILPGVDDGVREMADSLAILDAYAARGCRELWLTPHIMEDVPNTPDNLRKRFAELQNAYNGPITLHLGAENMLDQLFSARLEADDLLPLDNRRLLVETSYFAPPYNMEELLIAIKAKGFTPLLAHPERYVYMDTDDYKRLKDAGIELQLNIMSLVGFYGETALHKSRKLLRDGMYDRCGTDLHRQGQLRALDDALRHFPGL